MIELSNRSIILNKKEENLNGDYIAIYLKRDFRFDDNWIFVEAIKYSNFYNLPIKIFVYLPNKLHENKKQTKYSIFYPSKRQLDFHLKTINYLKKTLEKRGIPLEFRSGESPYEALKSDLEKAVVVLTDFKPTKPALLCNNNLSAKLNIKLILIDCHNIVPVWKASSKAEYMARTIRSKLWNNKKEFLINYPKYTDFKQINIKSKTSIPSINSISFVEDIFISNTEPGYINGMNRFKTYIKNNLKNYSDRNDPTIENSQSNMSIYINSGAVSAQKMVLILIDYKTKTNSSNLKTCIDDYIEEVWIRRELAENFCYYKDYTSINSAWDWAKILMKKETGKSQIYSLNQIENAKTDDPAWNASQNQLVKTGKIHGYMRMYWAKKIADWSKNRQIALDIANFLNDKYELDGNDSGGYTGTAWSIIGVHDRNFYGRFRPMTLAGLKSKKIDINKYIKKYIEKKNIFGK